MALDQEEIASAKAGLIRALFIDTADRDYVVARWSHLNEMYYQFFWNGAHALEKYLKAALLLNGCEVREERHDIKRLYSRFKPIAGELLACPT